MIPRCVVGRGITGAVRYILGEGRDPDSGELNLLADGEETRVDWFGGVGFGFEIEVTAKIAKLKCAVYEVPISYYGRTYEEGKKIGVTDGVAALWYIIKFNLLTSLASSYVQTPQLLVNNTPAIGRKVA